MFIDAVVHDHVRDSQSLDRLHRFRGSCAAMFGIVTNRYEDVSNVGFLACPSSL